MTSQIKNDEAKRTPVPAEERKFLPLPQSIQSAAPNRSLLLQYCLKVYYTREEKANLLRKFSPRAQNMVYYRLNGKIMSKGA